MRSFAADLGDRATWECIPITGHAGTQSHPSQQQNIALEVFLKLLVNK